SRPTARIGRWVVFGLRGWTVRGGLAGSIRRGSSQSPSGKLAIVLLPPRLKPVVPVLAVGVEVGEGAEDGPPAVLPGLGIGALDPEHLHVRHVRGGARVEVAAEVLPPLNGGVCPALVPAVAKKLSAAGLHSSDRLRSRHENAICRGFVRSAPKGPKLNAITRGRGGGRQVAAGRV